MLLYNWLSAINWTPGPDSSNLIKTEKAVPTKPESRAKIRYKVPMSLALDEKNHLSVQREKPFRIWLRLVLYLFNACVQGSASSSLRGL